ncbi:MAG: acyl-CoA carboxylase subunit beta [Polyangiaceae bacterium]|nr:acyl-CoA carboxylase subunit beta [Polyangiaceae bacterium]
MSESPSGKFDPSMPARPGIASSEPPLRSVEDASDKASRIRELEARIEAGGGPAAVAKLHARGKLTGWERIELLVDPGSFSELDKFIGSHRGVYRGNTITGHGLIDGRPVVVVSNMSESKAGAWYGESVFKTLRAQEFSFRHRIPIVFLVDSASAYLPEQEDVHSGSRHGGLVFHYVANHSGLFPQVAGVFGASVAGGAYLPGLSDFVPMVAGQSAMFLAGPKLVQAAIGEEVSVEELGGAKLHCRQSGVGDLECQDEASALREIRRFLSYLPSNHTQKPPRAAQSDDPRRETPLLETLIPSESRKGYDMRALVAEVVDRESFFELRPGYGQAIVVGLCRMDGRPVGVVASQPKHLGAVIDAPAADKAAWFISLCDAFNVPLLFLQDVPGFMVGSKAERGGIIHAGSRMIQAMARARVPRITVILRKAYGAGQYAMCGPGFAPTRVLALPTAETGTMAPEQLSEVVYGEALAMAGDNAAKRAAIEAERDAVVSHHNGTLGADYAASKGWYDAIVYPRELRAVLVREVALAAEHYEAAAVEGRRSICLT